MRRSFLSFIAILGLISYAPAKTITAAELRSSLRSALSLASETQLFIRQAEAGRLRRQFRTAHADYLCDEARRQSKELRESRTESGDSNEPVRYAEQLESLARVLTMIRDREGDARLPEARERVEAIKKFFMAAETGR